MGGDRGDNECSIDETACVCVPARKLGGQERGSMQEVSREEGREREGRRQTTTTTTTTTTNHHHH